MPGLLTDKFNFETTAMEDLLEFSQMLDTVAFVNLHDQPADKNALQVYCLLPDGTFGYQRLEGVLAGEGSIIRTFDTPTYRHSTIIKTVGDKIVSKREQGFICLKLSDVFTKAASVISTVEAQHYSKNHEMGHALVPYGHTGLPDHRSRYPYVEIAADAFGALRHIQTFDDPLHQLSVISWIRAHSTALHGNVAYATTPVLDKIIDDSATFDFRSLSNRETIKVAEIYAHDNLHYLGNAEPLMSTFGMIKEVILEKIFPQARLLTMARTALSTSNKTRFQIGARAFQPFLNPDGVELNGKITDIGAAKRAQLRDKFQQRAVHFKMSRLVRELEEKDFSLLRPAKAKQSGPLVLRTS